jgi:hypothetical protein
LPSNKIKAKQKFQADKMETNITLNNNKLQFKPLQWFRNYKLKRTKSFFQLFCTGLLFVSVGRRRSAPKKKI